VRLAGQIRLEAFNQLNYATNALGWGWNPFDSVREVKNCAQRGGCVQRIVRDPQGTPQNCG
jgi:hypothetical protein